VLRGRRIASSGTLARVLQRVHSTPSHPYPPLRHCAMVGEGLSGPTVAFHLDRPCFGPPRGRPHVWPSVRLHGPLLRLSWPR